MRASKRLATKIIGRNRKSLLCKSNLEYLLTIAGKGFLRDKLSKVHE
jgi:hypothetical protein